MEGFNLDDNEMNPNSTLRFCSLQQIKKLLRFIEICLVLVLLTWTSRHLPSAVRISGEYFRQLVTVVLSHLFIFFISNIIVLTLFFKSRALFLQHQSDQNLTEETDFYEEFVDAAAGRICPPPEEIVYEDKRTILEVRKVKVNRRSQSEKFRINDGGGCVKQLRRSETERQRRVAAEDELSNEEFQKAIDEFIAKQIKFHQEEKIAIVVHGSN